MPLTVPASNRLLRKLLGGFLLFGLALQLSAAYADETAKKPELPSAVEKLIPESVADLKAIQEQVKKVLDKAVLCTVCIELGGSSGSGSPPGRSPARMSPM